MWACIVILILSDKSNTLYWNLDHSANKASWSRKIINAQIRLVDNYTIEGYRIITGWAKLRKIYFRMELSKPVTTCTLVDGDRRYENMPVINGTCLKAVFDFGKAGKEPLLVKVALSPVSVENARENMRKETLNKSFDDVVAEADNAWEHELGKIYVKGSRLKKEIFYTALYHTMVQPNTMSDVNGEYMAADYSVRTLKNDEKHYSTFSLWDTSGRPILYIR